MKIVFGCDHGGYDLKLKLIDYVKELGHEVTDMGCNSTEAVDYPVVIRPVAQAVADGKFDRGIIICGTGIGVSIVANKVKGVRCALCSEATSARLSREHNGANILSLGARVTGEELSKDIVKVWLETDELMGDRHQRRRGLIE